MSTNSGNICKKALLESIEEAKWLIVCLLIWLCRGYEGMHVAGGMCSLASSVLTTKKVSRKLHRLSPNVEVILVRKYTSTNTVYCTNTVA